MLSLQFNHVFAVADKLLKPRLPTSPGCHNNSILFLLQYALLLLKLMFAL